MAIEISLSCMKHPEMELAGEISTKKGIEGIRVEPCALCREEQKEMLLKEIVEKLLGGAKQHAKSPKTGDIITVRPHTRSKKQIQASAATPPLESTEKGNYHCADCGEKVNITSANTRIVQEEKDETRYYCINCR